MSFASEGGISLSPAFVVMFVMEHGQLDYEDALHVVQNKRYCISPNGGFMTQIKVLVFSRLILLALYNLVCAIAMIGI